MSIEIKEGTPIEQLQSRVTALVEIGSEGSAFPPPPRASATIAAGKRLFLSCAELRPDQLSFPSCRKPPSWAHPRKV